MSGPYALEAFADHRFLGGVNLGSTEFAAADHELPERLRQHLHATTDVYNPVYATGIEALLPSMTPIDTLFAARQAAGDRSCSSSVTPTEADIAALGIPPAQAAQLAAVLVVPPTPLLPLSPQTPIFQLGFGDPTTPPYYLLTNLWRITYGADAVGNPDPALIPGTTNYGLPTTPPTQTTRLALYNNDMRNGPVADRADADVRRRCGSDGVLPNQHGSHAGLLEHDTVRAAGEHARSESDAGTTRRGQSLRAPADGIPGKPGGAVSNPGGVLRIRGRRSLPPAEAAAKAQGDVVAQTHAAEAPFCTEAAFQYFSSYILSLGG